MDTKQKIEFEKRMNCLRIQSLERMAVETNPHSSEFDVIVEELRVLEDKQKQLFIQGMEANTKNISAPGADPEEHP